jgi:hypothetical protein
MSLPFTADEFFEVFGAYNRAVAYQLAFSTRINPTVWLFGGFFLVQTFLFVWLGIVRDGLHFSSRGSARHPRGMDADRVFAGVSFLVQAEAESLMEAPWFGVPFMPLLKLEERKVHRFGPSVLALTYRRA